MALIVATLFLFAAGPFVLWPLIKTPPDEIVTSPTSPTSPLAGEGGPGRRPRPGGGAR